MNSRDDRADIFSRALLWCINPDISPGRYYIQSRYDISIRDGYISKNQTVADPLSGFSRTHLNTSEHFKLDGIAGLRQSKLMTFKELITQLAYRVGRQHIPVRDDAHDIHGFLGHDGVHHDLIKLTIRKIYKANQCGHLDAEVDWKPSIKAVIAIRNTLLQSDTADVEQVQFFDDLIDGISELLPWEETRSENAHLPEKSETVRVLKYRPQKKQRA